MNNSEKSKKIGKLLARIKTKSENFAKMYPDLPCDDLSYVIGKLSQIDEFLNDKYLTEKPSIGQTILID